MAKIDFDTVDILTCAPSECPHQFVTNFKKPTKIQGMSVFSLIHESAGL